jgi:hypothetical protein
MKPTTMTYFYKIKLKIINKQYYFKILNRIVRKHIKLIKCNNNLDKIGLYLAKTTKSMDGQKFSSKASNFIYLNYIKMACNCVMKIL